MGLINRLKNVAKTGKKKINESKNSQDYSAIEKGIVAAQETRRAMEELTSLVEDGRRAIDGVKYVVSREVGRVEKAGDGSSQALVALEGLYHQYGVKNSLVGKLFRKATGRGNQISLKDSLHILGNIAGRIPDYVNRLSQDLVNADEELGKLTGTIRQSIEDKISKQTEYDEILPEMEARLGELRKEYDALEREREQRTANMQGGNYGLNTRLNELEQEIGRLDDEYLNLKTERDNLARSVELSNGQIRKLKESRAQLRGGREVVEEAKNFVVEQVPYVRAELRTQEGTVAALTGVHKVMGFLELQDASSKPLNRAIQYGTKYLAGEVERIQTQIASNASITYQASEVGVLEGKVESSGIGRARALLEKPREIK